MMGNVDLDVVLEVIIIIFLINWYVIVVSKVWALNIKMAALIKPS